MNTTDTTSLLNEIATFASSSRYEDANRLLEIANESTEKTVTKAARKALYLLSLRGVVPSIVAPRAKVLVEATRLLAPIKGWATNFDGAGNQSVALLIPGSDGGNPNLSFILSNDEIGVKDWFTERAGKYELKSLLDKMKEMMDDGIAYAEVDPDYAHWLAYQGYAINQEKRIVSPHGFREFLNKIGDPIGEYNESLVYTVIPPEVLDSFGTALQQPKNFFESNYFRGWFFDVNDLAVWAGQWREIDHGSLRLPEDVKQARKKMILEQAVDHIFNDTTRKIITRRLEDTAFIFWKCDEHEIALQALHYARSLKQDLPASEIPFAQEIVQRTIEAAVALTPYSKN